MKFALQVINESAVLMVALIMGLYAYSRMTFFFRLMFFQLVTWILFYTVSYALTTWQKAHGQMQDTQMLMNFHLLAESTFLLTGAFLAAATDWKKIAAASAIVVFVAMFVVQTTIGSLKVYSIYTDLTACFLISFLYTMLLYRFFRDPSTPWWRSPGIFLSAGIVAYYASSVPYVALMNYLQRVNPQLNSNLYHLVNDVLANFRYLMMAIAFWLIGRNAALKNSTT